MSASTIPDTTLLDMQQCFALVRMSALALDQIGDSPKEAVAAVRHMRQVMDLVSVLAEQVLDELELSRRRGAMA